MKTLRVIFDELWQVCDSEPHGAAHNMALDEALLRHAERPLLRLYRWREPAVSFGYFGSWEEAERVGAGRELVRRWTGGGIVPHGRGEDLTYTLVVPRGEAFFRRKPGESYRAIHEAVARALGAGEARDGLSLAARGARLSQECFRSPVEHDVLAGERKIAGAAQRRTRDGMLHQGSIQQAGLGDEFGALLGAALAWEVKAREISADERAEAERLEAQKYGTDAWLRRVS